MEAPPFILDPSQHKHQFPQWRTGRRVEGGEDQYTLMIKHLARSQNYINCCTHTLWWCVFSLSLLHSLVEGFLSRPNWSLLSLSFCESEWVFGVLPVVGDNRSAFTWVQSSSIYGRKVENVRKQQTQLDCYSWKSRCHIVPKGWQSNSRPC